MLILISERIYLFAPLWQPFAISVVTVGRAVEADDETQKRETHDLHCCWQDSFQDAAQVKTAVSDTCAISISAVAAKKAASTLSRTISDRHSLHESGANDLHFRVLCGTVVASVGLKEP